MWNPASLLLVNGGNGNMAAKKKTTAIARRPNTTLRLIPAGKGHNPAMRRHKRRHNPATKGLLIEGLYAGAGAITTEILVGLLPWSFAWYIKAGIKAATGVALSAVAEKFAFTRPHATSIGLGGVAVGASDLLRNIVPSLAQQAGAVVQELIPIQLPPGAPTPVGAISAGQVQQAAAQGNQVAQQAAQALAGYGNMAGMGDIMFLPSARGLKNGAAGLGDLIYYPALRAAA
jgi:hypothetical protein